MHHLLWLHVDAALRRLALQYLLGQNAIVLSQNKDTLVYLTKIRDAWVIGLLTRF